MRTTHPRVVARKSKEMAPNSKELRVGMAYITAKNSCRGSNRRLARSRQGCRKGGAVCGLRVPLLPPTRPRSRKERCAGRQQNYQQE